MTGANKSLMLIPPLIHPVYDYVIFYFPLPGVVMSTATFYTICLENTGSSIHGPLQDWCPAPEHQSLGHYPRLQKHWQFRILWTMETDRELGQTSYKFDILQFNCLIFLRVCFIVTIKFDTVAEHNSGACTLGGSQLNSSTVDSRHA